MNKRIEELLTQSRKEVWSNNPFNGSPEFDGYEVDQEKFANLIVQECVMQLITVCCTQKLDANSFSRQIEEHFGI